MHASANLISFLQAWEGVHLKAYQDIAGIWTIGIGHTEGFIEGTFGENSEISMKQAEYLLAEDLKTREVLVNKLVEVELGQPQFDALLSFEFNTGGLGRSTALKRLNYSDYEGAAEALTWWNKARVGSDLVTVHGLVRRREAEKEMFLHGRYRKP